MPFGYGFATRQRSAIRPNTRLHRWNGKPSSGTISLTTAVVTEEMQNDAAQQASMPLWIDLCEAPQSLEFFPRLRLGRAPALLRARWWKSRGILWRRGRGSRPLPRRLLAQAARQRSSISTPPHALLSARQ